MPELFSPLIATHKSFTFSKQIFLHLTCTSREGFRLIRDWNLAAKTLDEGEGENLLKIKPREAFVHDVLGKALREGIFAALSQSGGRN